MAPNSLSANRSQRSRALCRSAHVDVFDAAKAGSVGTSNSAGGRVGVLLDERVPFGWPHHAVMGGQQLNPHGQSARRSKDRRPSARYAAERRLERQSTMRTAKGAGERSVDGGGHVLPIADGDQVDVLAEPSRR
jgi:hypothetical protein